MIDFKRGLKEYALEDVRNFLSRGVGNRILNHEDMLICIRNNYINVYLNGCSLLKYSPLATDDKKYLIHHKYMGLDLGNKGPYIPLEYDGNDLFYNGKSFTDRVIEKSTEELMSYINKNGEKRYLAQYLKSSPRPFLIDLEIAFTRERTAEEKKNGKKETVADRIDMAVLEEDNGRIILRMIEVKIDYDSRLKSQEEGKQEILKQMNNYKNEFLGKQYQNILDSYRLVADNYLQLGIAHKLNENNPEQVLKKFISNANQSLESLEPKSKPGDDFALDMDPYLLVIITDDKNMKGRNNICHFKRLQNEFFKSRYPLPQSWSSDQRIP